MTTHGVNATLAAALIGAAALATGCGDPSLSKEERKAIGPHGLNTKAAVLERYGEPMHIEELPRYEKEHCIYYEHEDPPYDDATWEICFKKNDEFQWAMTVKTEEIMRPGPAVPAP